MNSSIFFTFIVPATFSGQSAATELLIEGLSKKGWDCRLIPLYPLKRSIDNMIMRYWFFIKGQLDTCLSLIDFFSYNKPILHINLGQSLYSFIRVLVWLHPAILFKKKFVIITSLHGSVFMNWKNDHIVTKVFLFILKKSHIVTVLGETQKRKLVFLGIKESSIKVVLNPSELPSISLKNCENKHQKDFEINVLHLSLLVESKGFPVYLEAVKSFALKNLDVKINFILCGPLASTSFCRRFDNAIDKENWINNIINEINRIDNKSVSIEWVKGATGIKKQELFRWAHIFVLPTLFPVEAQPLVLLEAMASGCAIITTDVGEIRTILNDRTATFIKTKNNKIDLENLVFEIEKMSLDKNMRIKCSTNALKNFDSRFSMLAYINKWEEILSQMI